jgi:hypothetical protein
MWLILLEYPFPTHILHIVSWPIVLIPSPFNTPIYRFRAQGMFFTSSHDSLFRPPSLFKIPINCFRAQGMRSVSDVRRLDCNSGYRAWDQFLMWNIWSRFRAQGMRSSGFRGWDQFLMWNIWSRFRAQGIRSSGFRASSSEVGILYMKGSGFPPFAFLHPLSPYTQLFYSFPKHYSLSWPLTLKIFSALLVRLVVPQSGTWKPSSVSRLILPLRMLYVFSAFHLWWFLIFFYSLFLERDAHLLGPSCYWGVIVYPQ